MNDQDNLIAALISAKKIQIIPIGFDGKEGESERRRGREGASEGEGVRE
jgi:hypothetical protein